MTKLSASWTSRITRRACSRSLVVVSFLLCIYFDTLGQQQQQQQRQASLSSPADHHHHHYHQPVPILFAQAQHQRFIDSSTIKPALILILPQSFKIPTNPLLNDDTIQANSANNNQTKLKQYVAVINNAQDDLENDKIRQQYKKLSLQVRDASSPITGQLFYEHVFDYFAPDSPNHLLIPINLDHVSLSAGPKPTGGVGRPASHHQHLSAKAAKNTNNRQQSSPTTYSKLNRANQLAIDNDESSTIHQQTPTPPTTISQQLIVSIRPYQLDAGFGSDSIELVSSAPVLVEPVPSNDGRRSFSIVQTDKPIYKPTEKVRIRIMVVNENLRPIINDELRLQIKNPHGVIVEELRFPQALDRRRQQQQLVVNQSLETRTNEPMFLDHTFEFPTEPMLGAWTVHLLHNDPVANDTTSFEVKEYVLPPFEILFDTPDHILPSTRNIAGAVTAKYHYGKPVQGKVQFKFGYRLTPTIKTKYVARSNIKNIHPVTGRVEYNISLDKFREAEWFPAVNGARLVVEVTVTEMTTGHRETAQDTGCLFIQMPYKISFDESIEDFKPGLTQALTVRLVEVVTLKPGPAGQRIIATYQAQNGTYLNEASSSSLDSKPNDINKFDTEAITDSAGRAVFNIGPISDDITSLTVTMKLFNSNGSSLSIPKDLFTFHRFTGNELAIDHHTLIKHESQNGWIALMNKTVTHVSVGDQFVSDILIRDAMVLPKKIFYTILAKGQIILLNTIDTNGLVTFSVTEDMMPSIRLVLFALTHDSIGLLSDSMRIDVSQDLGCGLKLQYKSYQSQQQPLVSNNNNHDDVTVRPNDRGRIDITARYGDLVSLIGIDNAVYSLNNRTRLDSARIIERIRRLDTGCGFGGGKNNMDVFHNAGLMFHKDIASMGANEADTSHIGSSCLTVANQMKFTEEAAMGYSKPMLSLLSRAIGVAQRLRWAASQQQQQQQPQHKQHHNSRSKREVDPEAILKKYKQPLHRACCRLGTLEDIPQRRNCTIRRRIVEKYMQHQTDPCSSIYYECCRAVFGEPDVKLSNVMPLLIEPRIESRIFSSLPLQSRNAPRSDEMINFGQLDRIEASTLVRRDFRETWLFELVSVDDPTGKASLDVQLPHTISSWSIAAMALNKFRPMCIMPKPLKINTFQEVFIQLSLPYKVVQGEQIDMVATLYNYSPKNQDVLVYMYGLEDVCTEAEPGERSERRRVRVDKQSSQAVIFSMIPLKIGQYPIKVLAITLSSNNSDIIEQQLNVVPRGKPVTDEITFSLDPMNQQRRSKRAIQTGNLIDDIDSTRGLQHSQVRLTPSRESDYIVPQTQECIVSAIGDRMGQTVQTTILDVENLIQLPHGCGEQVMIYLGPTLYTAKYLSSINRLTGDLRWRAIRYIQSGYKSVLNFRKPEGSFSSFPKRDASIWLTAYVAKLLCQTERTSFIADEVYVDKTVINTALNWLIDQQKPDTGTWIERNPVYHREMLGGVLKEDALTAFVTITLNECAHHSQDIVVEERQDGGGGGPIFGNVNATTTTTLSAARVSALSSHPYQEQTNGVDRLGTAIHNAEESLILDRYRALRDKNPYVLALVAYSLSFKRPGDAASILSDLMSLSDRIQTKNQLLWRGEYPIETAAYALQALIELAPILSKQQQPTAGNGAGGGGTWMPGADAVAIANWLSSRRSYTGAFESTQDTVVALEALTKFAKLQSTPNGNSLIHRPSDKTPNLSCNVTFSNRTRRSIEFDQDNAQILQTFKLQSFDLDPISGETLDIMTSGDGLGTMSIKLKYNVYQDDDELCRFDIDSSIEEWQPAKVPLSPAGSSGDDNNNNKGNGDEQQQNDSMGEDDLFKTFDKSMLNELNLINQNDQINQASAGTTTGPQRNRQPPASAQVGPILRTRRYATTAEQVLDLSAKSGGHSNTTGESWTSKVVSSLKSRLPSWIAPKVHTSKAPTSPAPSTLPQQKQQASNGQMIMKTTADNSRRNATSRRSTQSQAPMITTPAGIPIGAHLNTLSSEFDINGNQSKTITPTNTSLSSPSSSSSSLGFLTDSPSRRLILLLRVCAHHMSSRRDSEMAVIEVGVLSGFKPNEADLKEILNDIGTPAMKYELSADRSLVILYLKYIPYTGPYCFQFRLVRDSLVYNLQSGYIRVYEYYSPTHSCSNFYTPSRVNNLLETKCDPSGQVCQCASRSLCPATKRLVEIGETSMVNSTSAREQLIDLVCSNKYDLVSLVRLKSVRYMETGQMFKLSLKIKSDLRGNLTKIVEAQRQQKAQLVDSVRRPVGVVAAASTGQLGAGGEPSISTVVDDESSLTDSALADDTSLDYLSMSIDANCVRGDPMLLHLAHPNQWRLGGELMILFARSNRVEKLYFKSTPKSPTSNQRLAPSSSSSSNTARYSQLAIALDRDSILHDITYQAKLRTRESINNLILWLDLKARRENWNCPIKTN
uniref:Complement C3 n=1 Tax=Aceria tosichella TaxID=561515 RepID=A0A6G1SMG7_9ACAR